ncbi:MAG TPA: hypothetical protein VNT30_11450 [Stellaceae bacterium]|nr:hypothetical protein [Stellaceae bacterium]
MADRLPPIPAEAMTPAQRVAAAEIVAGARGALYGPFVPLLRSPELMSRLQKTGEYLRYGSAVPERLKEFVILLVARHHDQQVEWAIHQPIALAAGLAPGIVDAVAEGRRPGEMADDEAVIHDFVIELRLTKGVSDPTYGRALVLLGEQGVVDLVAIVGYYTVLALVMNVARTPVPPSKLPSSLPVMPLRTS